METVGQRFVERYKEEILDYRALVRTTVKNDIVASAVSNLDYLVESLLSGEPISQDKLDSFGRSGVRRAKQGVSIEAVLHAYRVWGHVVWAEVQAAADPDSADERDALLWMAGRVMEHVDIVSTAVTQAYMDEFAGVWSDRAVIRHDLLETLISGRSITEHARGQVAALEFELTTDHAVAVARVRDRGSGARERMRAALGSAKRLLTPTQASLLIGLREDEVVAIYPLAGPSQTSTLHQQARALAAEVPDFAVGIGAWHSGVEGIATSYEEAQEAIAIGLATGRAGRAMAFADVLLDQMVRTSRYSETLLRETLRPLREYDRAHNAPLVATLRAYFDTRFNLTRSAEVLCVHPNTVVYRLRRVKELTGRDPAETDDLLLLGLGLKLLELGEDLHGFDGE